MHLVRSLLALRPGAFVAVSGALFKLFYGIFPRIPLRPRVRLIEEEPENKLRPPRLTPRTTNRPLDSCLARRTCHVSFLSKLGFVFSPPVVNYSGPRSLRHFLPPLSSSFVQALRYFISCLLPRNRR